MDARFQSIRSRRGSVMVYALVFAISAAVVLYVASSIYQARQKAAAVADYSAQRTLVGWNAAYVMGSSTQFSLETGSGVADDNAWVTYNTATSPHSYVAAGWPAGYSDIMSPTGLFTTAANNILWQQNASHNSLWKLSGNITVDATNAGTFASGFGKSGLFTIPGYMPRSQINGFPNTAASTGVFAATSPNQDFQWLHDITFVAPVLSSLNFPFTNPPGMSVAAATANRGKVRWVKDAMTYTLTPADQTTVGAITSVASKNITFVEEPITNYQLLLLAPPGNTAWNPVIPSGSSISLLHSASAGGAVSYGKMLIWGSVDSGFAINPGASTNGQAPLAAVAGGSVLGNARSLAYDWRVAKPRTKISFGRGQNPVTQVAPATLANYLSGNLTDSLTNASNLQLLERQLTVANAQASVMSPLPTTPTTTGNFAYVNSVLAFSANGKYWASQQGVTTTGNVMGASGSTSNNPTQLTFTNSGGNGSENWGVSSALTLPFSGVGSPLTLDSSGTRWISAAHYYNGLTHITEVKVNLAVYDSPASSATVENNGSVSPWTPPHELLIYKDTTVNPSANLVVTIQGDGSAGAAAKAPLRVAINGGGTTGANAVYIRLVPDPTAGNVANLRRCIIVCQSPAVVSFDTSGATGFNNTAAKAWYGVLMVPWGVTFRSDSASYVNATYQIPSAAAKVNWFGTVLAGSFCNIDNANTGNAGLTMILAPDEGTGTTTAGPEDAQATYSLFTPKYDSTVKAGRPVPLVVPRLIWSYAE